MADSDSQDDVHVRAEGIVAGIADSFNMIEDQQLAKRREYSVENDDYPFEVLQSYEYSTSDAGPSTKVYLTSGIEKETGQFAASIYHSTPLVKTEFSARLQEALVLELTREFPGASVETEPTRAWHILGP